MVQTMENAEATTEEQIRLEHSKSARARRIMDGGAIALAFQEDDIRTVPPINHTLPAATALEITDLEFNKSYRMISDVGFHYLVGSVGDAAVTDTYVPADTPMIIRLENPTKRISAYSTPGGFLQFSEIK